MSKSRENHIAGRARIRGWWVAFVLVSCAPSSGASPPRPAPTDTDACPRLCAVLDRCGGAPHDCEVSCRRDAARLRPGFSASFVSCVERQMTEPGCGAPEATAMSPSTARSEHVRLCYYATVEAYAAGDAGAAMGRVIAAVCRRRVRCGGADAGAGAQDTCVAELRVHTKGATTKILAVAKYEAVTEVSACVEKRPCADEDPVGDCFVKLEGGPT